MGVPASTSALIVSLDRSFGEELPTGSEVMLTYYILHIYIYDTHTHKADLSCNRINDENVYVILCKHAHDPLPDILFRKSTECDIQVSLPSISIRGAKTAQFLSH